ncbi:MAG: TolC family protein [Steroidobacteraceae bacterium]
MTDSVLSKSRVVPQATWRRAMLLILLLPSAGFAQDAALSLDEAIALALQQAPEISAGEAGLMSAQSMLRSAGRLPDPQLIAGIDNLPANGPDSYSLTSDFMTMRKVGLAQNFPNATKRRLQRELASANVTTSEFELQQTRLEITRGVTQAWIALASTDTALQELRALLADVQLQARSARSSLAAGRDSSADALMAEMAVVQFDNRLLALETEAHIAQAELSRWIGQAAARPQADMPALDQLPASGDALRSSIHQHAYLLPLEARIAAAHTNVELAKSEKRPDWSGELTYALRGAPYSNMVSLQFRIGLPLFARDRQDPQIAAKGADLRRLQAERESEVRMHDTQIQEMLARWQSLGVQLTRFDKELLPLSKERHRAAMAGLSGGRGDLKAVIDAATTRGDLLIEQARLTRERGEAWAYLRTLQSKTPQTLSGDKP